MPNQRAAESRQSDPPAPPGGLPRGPQALPREEVAAHQRERLFAAMLQAVDAQGFVATTISDLVERAGVSRRTFYEHFENKDQCLLATYDMIFNELVERISSAEMPGENWLQQIEGVLSAVFEVTVRRPDAARLVCVELAAAGPPGVERWAQGGAMLAQFIGHDLSANGGPEGVVPDPIARAIVGALRNILYSRVRRKRSRRALRAQLTKVLPELMTWVSSYYPSPAAIPQQPLPMPQAEAENSRRSESGRAPGTLSLSPSWSTGQGLPPGEHNLPRGFVVHNQRERIFDAIAKRTAAEGYQALGLEDIVAGASVSLQTFYQHFENKEEAFLATYEVGHAKAVAAVRRSLDLNLDWTTNVKRGVKALLEFLASEPAFAHLACVDILIAYPHVAERLDEANYSFAELLDLRLDSDVPSRMPSTVSGEAIVGGIFELLHDYILHGKTAQLPELTDHATYIALAPLIGAEAAWAAVASS
ncbi:MAG TPA: TetR/AcrR family transcriptional regulator [Solirubrobacteraceae bacterium]